MSRRLALMICLSGFVLAGAVEQSSAQVVSTPGAIRDNAGSGGAAARAPGNMVSAGVARAQGFAPKPLVPIVITDTAPASIRSQLIADLLQTLFDNLNLALVALQTAVLAQAGQPPMIPAGILPTTTNTTNTSGTGGSSGTNPGGVPNLPGPLSGFLPQGNAGN